VELWATWQLLRYQYTIIMSNLPELPNNEEDKELDALIARIESKFEHKKKLAFWDMGKDINAHLKKKHRRSDYGTYMVQKMSAQLKIDKSSIYLSVRFFEAYPKIVETSLQLTWSHYVVLLTIPDLAARKQLEEQAISDHLSSRDLAKLIRSEKTHALPAPPTLSIERTAPFVYVAETVLGQTMVDLGFTLSANITAPSPITLEQHPHIHLGSTPHYTYKAVVIEVVDGDTFWAVLDLGFNMFSTQKLRLRGIDAPELNTPEGLNAKEYVQTQLRGCTFIAIKTYWRDKYDRYLADVLYDKDETNLATLVANGKFLNQELLDKGLAVKV